MANNPNNSKVFDFITHEPEFQIADVDKTKTVDLFAEPKKEWTKEGVHNALMVAGFTPVIGNAADLIDAGLYAMEGEFGSAALSAVAAIPVIGQISSGLKVGQKILQEAVNKGDELIDIFHGVNKWHKGTMVNKGRFIGGSNLEAVSPFAKTVKGVTKDLPAGTLYSSGIAQRAIGYSKETGPLLHFVVPKSYIKKYGKIIGQLSFPKIAAFEFGLPKEFLVKVYKSKDPLQEYLNSPLSKLDKYMLKSIK